MALDYCVAVCEGHGSPELVGGYDGRGKRQGCYSSDWPQGGPIIERELQELYVHSVLECWAAKHTLGDLRYGPTPLIAAMRCYVASKMGDVVEIPDELI